MKKNSLNLSHSVIKKYQTNERIDKALIEGILNNSNQAISYIFKNKFEAWLSENRSKRDDFLDIPVNIEILKY